jgi:hypothetical protein
MKADARIPVKDYRRATFRRWMLDVQRSMFDVQCFPPSSIFHLRFISAFQLSKFQL